MTIIDQQEPLSLSNDDDIRSSIDDDDLVASNSRVLDADKDEQQRNRNNHRSVGFAAADIIEFEPTLWTASVTSGGVPLGMSTTERKRSRRRLDSYEHERKPRRISKDDYMEEGYMDIDEREHILSTRGHRTTSFDFAEQEMCQISEERRESNEHDNKYQFGLGEADLIHDEDDVDEDMQGNLMTLKSDVDLVVPLLTVQKKRKSDKGLLAAPTVA